MHFFLASECLGRTSESRLLVLFEFKVLVTSFDTTAVGQKDASKQKGILKVLASHIQASLPCTINECNNRSDFKICSQV